MKHVEKGAGYEQHMLPAELASFLGVTTRTVRRWMQDPTFPKPAVRNAQGFKLWSPDEARRCLEWRLKRVPEAK
jgi:hypothetical protein